MHLKFYSVVVALLLYVGIAFAQKLKLSEPVTNQSSALLHHNESNYLYTLFGQDDHVRMFGKDYSKRIERAGLKAIEDDFAKTQSQKFGLQNAEIIYKGVKV